MKMSVYVVGECTRRTGDPAGSSSASKFPSHTYQLIFFSLLYPLSKIDRSNVSEVSL